MNSCEAKGSRFLRNKVSPRIKAFAKKLRRNQTHSESILWDCLKDKQLFGLKFRRQHIIRGYIADFFCPAKHLAVEVDGLGHDREKDALRDSRILAKCQIKTIRFSNWAVENETLEVLKTIALACGISAFPQIHRHNNNKRVFENQNITALMSPVETVENLKTTGEVQGNQQFGGDAFPQGTVKIARTSLEKLLEQVALQHGYTVEELQDKNHRSELVKVRRVFAYAARQIRYSLPAIGRALHRHHTTVLNLLKDQNG